MALLYQVPTQNNLQYTLSSQLAQGGTSAALSVSVAGIVNAPGVFVVDRVDANGNKTPASREYISFTGVSTNTLTGLSKGLSGSTDQAHNVGAIVEFVPDVTQQNAIYNVITTEHTTMGVHSSLPSLYVTNTQFASIDQQLTASGATLQGFPIRPVWYLPGTLSGATTAVGSPLAMTDPANIQWISVTLQQPASQASLQFNVNKNYTSILGSSNVLTVPINGTYVSTASISTLAFKQGDFLTVDVSNASSFGGNAMIQIYAR